MVRHLHLLTTLVIIVGPLTVRAASLEAAPSYADNDISGEPAVFCGEDGVRFEIETSQPFTGKIYARNEYYRDTCRSSFAELPQSVKLTKGGEFKLNFNDCGVKRERMINPVRGMSYSVTMVVQFHDTFVTSHDKAYDVRCFYKERTVSVDAGQIDVSPLSTDIINIDHPLPRCSYSIRHKSAHGPPATFARVGDPVVHVFSCDNDVGTYNILVRDCKISDGQGNERKLIDEHGCSTDNDLISTPEYGSLNLAAYATATVFKWPDEAAVYFSCQMTLCMKADDDCLRMTPPKCGGSSMGGVPRSLRRRRRDANRSRNSNETSVEASGLIADLQQADDVLDVDLQVRRLVVLDADQVIDPVIEREPQQKAPPSNFDIESSLGELVSFSTSLDGQPVLVGEQVQRIVPTLVEPPSVSSSTQEPNPTEQPSTETAPRPPTQPPTTTTELPTKPPPPQQKTTTKAITLLKPKYHYEHQPPQQQQKVLPVQMPATTQRPSNKQVEWPSAEATTTATPQPAARPTAAAGLAQDISRRVPPQQHAPPQDLPLRSPHREEVSPRRSQPSHPSVHQRSDLDDYQEEGGPSSRRRSSDLPSRAQLLAVWQRQQTCYGVEYVIGFAVVLALFVLVLSLLTVKLLHPYAREYWRRYRKSWSALSRHSTSPTATVSNAYASPMSFGSFGNPSMATTPPPDYVPVCHSRLNVRALPMSTAAVVNSVETSGQPPQQAVYGSSCYLTPITPAPAVSHH